MGSDDAAAIPDFDSAAAILRAAGVAQAADSSWDIEQLAAELGMDGAELLERIGALEGLGLMQSGIEDGLAPILHVAGRQYLDRRGAIDPDVLRFLPRTLDNLDTRRALLRAGSVLVDEFACELAQGTATEYARQLVPPAFAAAVTERLAADLFAAAAALLARLSAGLPAGCLAEEIVAVSLADRAAMWLEMEAQTGVLSAEDADAAAAELGSLFELFQDDDVLDMFQMKEPADAAVRGESPVARQLGIADQRLAAWFAPFWGFAATGHLADAQSRAQDPSSLSGRLLTPVEAEPVTLDQEPARDRFRVCIRVWEDSLAHQDPRDQLPDCWIYHVTAATAEDARAKALRLFPADATLAPMREDGAEAVALDRQEIARLAVDVQRVGLPQALKAASQFHIVGRLALAEERKLGLLAGHLAAAFPAAVLATDATDATEAFLGVTVNAESFEEAAADLDDQLASFAERHDVQDALMLGSSSAAGGRDARGLLREIELYAGGAENDPPLGR